MYSGASSETRMWRYGRGTYGTYVVGYIGVGAPRQNVEGDTGVGALKKLKRDMEVRSLKQVSGADPAF